MTRRSSEVVTWPERWRTRDAQAFDLSSHSSGRLPAIERVAELAGPRATSSRLLTLEVGCGTGLFAKAARARHLIGLDISVPMLHVARTRMDRVCQQDLFHPGVRPESVDNLVCLFVVDDYPTDDKRSFFHFARAVLRRDGHVFLAAYSPADEYMGRTRSATEPAVYLESRQAYLDYLAEADLSVYSSETLHATGQIDVGGSIRREFLLFAAKCEW